MSAMDTASRHAPKRLLSTCVGCDKPRFTMTVRICAGSLDALELPMCLECRIAWSDDQWACLASTIEHAAARRAANSEALVGLLSDGSEEDVRGG